jgi:hypothetical protein
MLRFMNTSSFAGMGSNHDFLLAEAVIFDPGPPENKGSGINSASAARGVKIALQIFQEPVFFHAFYRQHHHAVRGQALV